MEVQFLKSLYIFINLRIYFQKIKNKKWLKFTKMYWVQSCSNEPKTMSDDKKTIDFFEHFYVIPF
jgi:hypothetical protein